LPLPPCRYFYNAEGVTVWELPFGDTAVPEGSGGAGDAYGDENEDFGQAEVDYGQGDAYDYGQAEGGYDQAEAYGDSASAYGADNGGGDDGWEEVLDDAGNVYWYNSATGEAQYS